MSADPNTKQPLLILGTRTLAEEVADLVSEIAGLEDKLYYDAEKTRPAANEGLVERIAALGRAAERPPVKPDEARAIIGLPARSD